MAWYSMASAQHSTAQAQHRTAQHTSQDIAHLTASGATQLPSTTNKSVCTLKQERSHPTVTARDCHCCSLTRLSLQASLLLGQSDSASLAQSMLCVEQLQPLLPTISCASAQCALYVEQIQPLLPTALCALADCWHRRPGYHARLYSLLCACSQADEQTQA